MRQAGSALAHLLALLVLAGCAGAPPKGSSSAAGARKGQGSGLPHAGSGRGGYYQDDGPGDNLPPDLDRIPDAQPRVEPYAKANSRPYVVFGTTYTPITHDLPFSQRGVGSWYGKKFHDLPTASGEPYDMYKMTAAHPTLPIPSYARLTSMVSGKQVIVRINDRGPFHASRVIDVSYTAALQLGLLGKGSHELFIERLLPAEIERIRLSQRNGAPQAAAEQGPVTSAVSMPESAPLAQLPAPLPPQLPPPLPLPLPPQATGPTLLPVVAPGIEPASMPVASGAGFYLQLGAFAQADNAAAARVRLEPYAPALGRLDVVQAGAVHRLYGGPFANREDALRAIEGLPGALGLKPIIVQR